MFEINKITARTCSMLGQRGSIFGLASLEAAKDDEKFILMTADLATLSGMERYINMYPSQFINVGIAEQNMIGLAAGLAAEGYHPVATTYATFITMRACEQIRHFLGYMKQKVVIVGSGAGLSQGFAGNTHYTIEDISMMRAIPNLQVISPADAASAVKIFNSALSSPLSSYIRLTGNLNCPTVYKEDTEFALGGSKLLRDGKDIAIYACGTMVSEALRAADILKSNGIESKVIDMYSIKPLDHNAIVSSRECKLIVSIEEHNKMGGLGAALAEVLCERQGYPKLLRLGINDCFDLAGDYESLLITNRLKSELIASDILDSLH